MKQVYKSVRFRADTLRLIDTLNDIVEDYIAQGYVLTVRQLYYQMVARGHIENTERSYKHITGVVNDARLSGLIDWDGIEDRTREFIKRSRWTSPAEILRAVAKQYHEDLWVGQQNRVFVIVEKEALAGVLEGVCHRFDVPLLAARGYPSGTVLREFAQVDLNPTSEAGQTPVILHLGDHDPSGIDMSRDLQERMDLFASGLVDFRRIALNMLQIKALNPPENPAKVTDSRFEDYRKQYGDKSWELDALTPSYLVQLVEANIASYITRKPVWGKREAKVQAEKDRLVNIASTL